MLLVHREELPFQIPPYPVEVRVLFFDDMFQHPYFVQEWSVTVRFFEIWAVVIMQNNDIVRDSESKM